MNCTKSIIWCQTTSQFSKERVTVQENLYHHDDVHRWKGSFVEGCYWRLRRLPHVVIVMVEKEDFGEEKQKRPQPFYSLHLLSRLVRVEGAGTLLRSVGRGSHESTGGHEEIYCRLFTIVICFIIVPVEHNWGFQTWAVSFRILYVNCKLPIWRNF